MTDRQTLLIDLMDRFGREHWDDSYSPGRASLSTDDDKLFCTVGDEVVEGHASAPLLFLAGAWGLIYAEECQGRFGHRIGGHLNRIWPNRVDTTRVEHAIHKEVKAWAAEWPDLLFSSSLYHDVDTPGHPRHPRCLDDAPGKTSLTGILKRVVKTAGDADPLERLKVAEFIEETVRYHWSTTAEDSMMAVVGAPLIALLNDSEPAIRELAVLALETCAKHCWRNRAYGLYEPICHKLIEQGLNVDLQFIRLAESAYASCNMDEGYRLWAIGFAGQNPLRPVKLSAAYDHIGDLTDLHTRILRQAGGAHVGYLFGNDPNPARNAKLEKNGITLPEATMASHHSELARTLLARAAEEAEKRLAIDLPAAQDGKSVPLGSGEIDPKGRRLFLHDIFFLQSRLAEANGDEEERLRLLFKAQAIVWQLQGDASAYWRWGNEAELITLAITKNDAELKRLGMPSYLMPLLKDERTAASLVGSKTGQEQLFWQRFLLSVREQFHRKTNWDYNPLPGEELAAGFVVTRHGGEMRITHDVLPEPVCGLLSTPVLNALRAWHEALKAAHGIGVWFETHPYNIIALGAEDIPILAAIAAETFAADAKAEAVALYRFAAGTDPLVQPWPYKNPVKPLPLDQIPAELREMVAQRAPLEVHDGHLKVKPRGRRIEQLAGDFAQGDAVTARYIGQYLRDACHAGSSEIIRVVKSGQPLLLDMWSHPDSMVREIAILPILELLYMCSIYFKGAEIEALMKAAEETAIADITHLRLKGNK